MTAAVVKQVTNLNHRATSKGLKNRKISQNSSRGSKREALKSVSLLSGHEELTLVKPKHYLFNRVWIVDHILDENSPLCMSVSSSAKAYHAEQARQEMNQARSVNTSLTLSETENIRRNLDIESILKLPIVTYQSDSTTEEIS